MTYSITARDPETGRLGIAVQSCVFAVGTRVPAVDDDVCAVAMQAGSETRMRIPAVALARQNLGAADIVAALATVPGAGTWQFAIVDRAGRAAAHTGTSCTKHAGHAVGGSAVAAANLVERDGMWEEMLSAYEHTTGSFEDRLIAALQAGEAAGGDVRGRQSAALLVTTGSTPDGGALFRTDLRVDDHHDPVEELARLWKVKGVHNALRRSFGEARNGRSGWGPMASALAPIAEDAPGDSLAMVWTGVSLFLAGREEEARPWLAMARRDNPRLVDYLSRDSLLAGEARRDDLLAMLAGIPDGAPG
jgi:uncharacterized Ntn-hydrolase superfamily protein